MRIAFLRVHTSTAENHRDRMRKILRCRAVSQLTNLFRRSPKPRCSSCHKWNRVYLTGGSFLSQCVHCGARLELRRPPALWGVLVILGVGVLALAAAIPLLNR
jgi:hypothetical protein